MRGRFQTVSVGLSVTYQNNESRFPHISESIVIFLVVIEVL